MTWLSTCCSAPPIEETEQWAEDFLEAGICSDCRDWAGFVLAPEWSEVECA